MISHYPPLPRICACCASTLDVERHHLYSIRDGCPDDLQIWLCRVCHERTHGLMTGGLHYRRLVTQGIDRARVAGKYKGRKSSIDAGLVKFMAVTHGPTEIAKTLRIARSSVYRLLQA